MFRVVSRYPCDSKSIATEYQNCFPLTTFPRTHSAPGDTLVHNKFKFFSVSRTFSLILTNTPGTAKVLGSNQDQFFFKR